MRSDYSPRPGSLAARVCAWFKSNPEGRLTREQIRQQFGAETPINFAGQLGAAEDADLLASELVEGRFVYQAGPRLDKWAPAMEDTAPPSVAWKPAAAAPAASAQRPPKRPPKRVTVCDADELVIEDDIPMPGASRPLEVERMQAKIASMRVGQSFQRPHDEAQALIRRADNWSRRHRDGKVKFALRRIDDKHSRVWRTE